MDSMRTPQEQAITDEILTGIEELATTISGPMAMFLGPVMEMVRPQVESVSPSDLQAFLVEARDKINSWLTPAPGLPLPEPERVPELPRLELLAAQKLAALALPEPAAVPPTEVIVLGRAPQAEPEVVPASVPVVVLSADSPLPEPAGEVVVRERSERPAEPPGEAAVLALATVPPEGATGVRLDENGFGEWYDPLTGAMTIRQPTLNDAVVVADAINTSVNPTEKAQLMQSGALILEYLSAQLTR